MTAAGARQGENQAQPQQVTRRRHATVIGKAVQAVMDANAPECPTRLLAAFPPNLGHPALQTQLKARTVPWLASLKAARASTYPVPAPHSLALRGPPRGSHPLAAPSRLPLPSPGRLFQACHHRAAHSVRAKTHQALEARQSKSGKYLGCKYLPRLQPMG